MVIHTQSLMHIMKIVNMMITWVQMIMMQDVMKEMDGMNHFMTDNDGDQNMEPPKCPSSMNTTTTHKMTDTQKIEALTDLLESVIHRLDMKQYEIEDATQSHQCEVEADDYHQKMITILHSNWIKQNVHDSLLYALSTTMENANILYIRWSTKDDSILSLLWISCRTD